ncbi:YqiJ family protein [Jannaschia donghaensis]|uniref:Inner membrane protein YqiJ n=1 Tax=Jannaschia donghaensis TaxID=420998 RepID=A0A0M6YLL7_9RHOB|nr:YqiJ family protein [Jannaschia donghaensis]CTQ51251.1 Inner membrane protein YqiJ [Jannaschia donghaensis]
MLDLFLIPEAVPFSIALTVVLGLFFLEVVGLVLGGTLLGLGGESPDIDVDADFDLTADVDPGGVTSADVPNDMSAAPSDILTWIGARDVPVLIWLVSFLTMFGLFGLLIQLLAMTTIGAPLYTVLAVIIAAIPALAVTRVIANWVALIMPKTETSAMRTRFLGGHRGTITQGTARRGQPAEVKIKDRHRNIHYLRVEPLEDDGVFPQGSDVTLIRKRGDKFFVI